MLGSSFALMNYDAIVIGAGPNGLAAAIELARAGKSVCVYEANRTIGGGARTAELTLPGFLHDVCSAVHPLAAGSPFFSKLPLDKYGLEFIYPSVCLAHPFDDGTAVVLNRSVALTSKSLGQDGSAYKKLFLPVVERWNELTNDLLGPPRFPRHPLIAAGFGVHAIRSAKGLAESIFVENKTRAFFAGLAAHSFLALDRFATAAFALMLGAMGHVIGWPIARGGSQRIANALAEYLVDLGGEIITDCRVDSLAQLPPARAILCDMTPRQVLRVAEDLLSSGFRHKLNRLPIRTGSIQNGLGT